MDDQNKKDMPDETEEMFGSLTEDILAGLEVSLDELVEDAGEQVVNPDEIEDSFEDMEVAPEDEFATLDLDADDALGDMAMGAAGLAGLDMDSEDSFEDMDAEPEDDGYFDELDEDFDRLDDDFEEIEPYVIDDIEDDEPEGGVWKRIIWFFGRMTAADRVVMAVGCLVLIVAVVTAVFYGRSKAADRELASFTGIGSDVQSISLIGESGLIAVADASATRLSEMLEEEAAEEEEEEEEDTLTDTVNVGIKLSSIQSDLKIKFVNEDTNKLISKVPFEVEVSASTGKTYSLKDEDKDGIIYQTGLAADTYTVTVIPLTDEAYAGFVWPTKASSIKVTDAIVYQKVDVTDEIKTEDEVDVEAEDTAQHDIEQEEPTLTDTVEWVESTRTELSSTITYKEIDKDTITDPSTVSRAFNGVSVISGYYKTSYAMSKGTRTTSAISLLSMGNLQLTTAEDVTDSNTSESGNGSNDTNESGSDSDADDGNGDSKEGESGSQSGSGQSGDSGEQSGSDEDADEEDTGEEEVTYTAITITGDTSVTEGETITLSATTTPKGGTVTWKSSDTSIATVDSSGKVTGVSAGTATITATCGDIKATYDITVEKDYASDTTSLLEDNSGNQVYVKDSSGNYTEATYADYYSADTFYIQEKTATYRYTGWQTIDGYTYYYDKNGNYVTGSQVILGVPYEFGKDGHLTTGSGTLGIDVSKWNGSIDWNSVKNAGISFVIIRCGYRGSSTGALIEDPYFYTNIKGAKAAGLKVGVYFYSQAITEAEAVEEASMALSLVSGYSLDYPIFIDVESSGGRGDNISVSTRTAVCKAFCATIQNSGYKAGIYSNKNWFTSYINTSSLTAYKIWVAQYASAVSYTATRYDMWQYSSSGSVPGISGSVDMNLSYLSY